MWLFLGGFIVGAAVMWLIVAIILTNDIDLADGSLTLGLKDKC